MELVEECKAVKNISHGKRLFIEQRTTNITYTKFAIWQHQCINPYAPPQRCDWIQRQPRVTSTEKVVVMEEEKELLSVKKYNYL